KPRAGGPVTPPRKPTMPFIAWLVFEIAVCVARLVVLLMARRAADQHRDTPTDVYLILAIAWSLSVGYGVSVSMASGDWVAATLACLSSAAMVGGICFRNFSAPRLAAAMILTSLGPIIYLTAISAAAFRLNKMLISVMH